MSAKQKKSNRSEFAIAILGSTLVHCAVLTLGCAHIFKPQPAKNMFLNIELAGAAELQQALDNYKETPATPVAQEINPEPEQKTEPVSESVPEPVPEPIPEPVPQPEPVIEPKPELIPEPMPKPQPIPSEPKEELVFGPKMIETPEPVSEPEPAPAPEPEPEIEELPPSEYALPKELLEERQRKLEEEKKLLEEKKRQEKREARRKMVRERREAARKKKRLKAKKKKEAALRRKKRLDALKRIQKKKSRKNRLSKIAEVVKKNNEEKKKKELLAKKKKDNAFNDMMKYEKKNYASKAPKKTSGIGGYGNGLGSYGDGMGVTESDAAIISSQIVPHWVVAGGVKNAEKLIIRIRIKVKDNGEVSFVEIIDKDRYNSDRVFKSAADSAKRAILQASPLKIPADKMHLFRDFDFSFNTDKALGVKK